MKRFFRWLAVNSVFAVMVYLGTYGQIDGAKNVAIAFAWIGLITSFIAPVEAVAREFHKTRPSDTMIVVDVCHDIIIACVMFWYGWIFTGIAYLIHIFMLQVGRERGRQLAEKE